MSRNMKASYHGETRAMKTIAHLAIVLATISASAALATPVQWKVADGGNDHWYDVILKPEGLPQISWTQAKDLTDADPNWHLATITSQAENDFVFNLVDGPSFWTPIAGSFQGPFLGGFSFCNACND